MPIYTIHDCIATTKGNEHVIKSIMVEEITRYFGFSPSLKIESGQYQTEVIKLPVTVEEELLEAA